MNKITTTIRLTEKAKTQLKVLKESYNMSYSQIITYLIACEYEIFYDNLINIGGYICPSFPEPYNSEDLLKEVLKSI